MKIYRISEGNAAGERSAILRRTGFITGAAVLAGVLLGVPTVLAQRNLAFMMSWVAIMAGFLCLLIWRALAKQRRFLDDAYSTFQITEDGTTLTKTQKNTPDVCLLRTEIKRIDEYEGKGFRICTSDRFRNIWVPCEVDDYEQLKADLLSMPGVLLRHESHSWLRTYAVFGIFLTLFAISVIAKDKRIVCGTSVAVSSYLFFFLLKYYRNPNLTKRTKRQLLWAGFAGICLLIRALVVWRS